MAFQISYNSNFTLSTSGMHFCYTASSLSSGETIIILMQIFIVAMSIHILVFVSYAWTLGI